MTVYCCFYIFCTIRKLKRLAGFFAILLRFLAKQLYCNQFETGYFVVGVVYPSCLTLQQELTWSRLQSKWFGYSRREETNNNN